MLGISRLNLPPMQLLLLLDLYVMSYHSRIFPLIDASVLITAKYAHACQP